MNKLVLGIYIDGLSVQAALVSYDQGLYQIESLNSYKLFDPLDQKLENTKKTMDAKKHAFQDMPFEDSDDPFGFDSDVRTAGTTDLGQARGNIDVLIEILTKMAPPEVPIAFNLHPSNVNYKVIQADKNTSLSKIRKLVWNEFNENSDEQINPQHIALLPLENDAYLGMFHNDSLVFSTLLGEACKLMKRPISPIALIDTVEFALAEYISRTVDLTENDRAAVVLFSQNLTKIFFMKGKLVENVLPTIHTGARSSKICETAFAKMLYEFDFKGIDSPHNIVLVGEVDQVQAEEFFKNKFPNLNIIKLETNESYLAPNVKEFENRTAPFSVAIAMAVKALQSKKTKTYNFNFLPKRIKDRQSEFVVAWHGFAMLGILFLTILFLFTQNIRILNHINQSKGELNQINLELANLQNVEHDVDSLRLEIANIEKGASLIDSLGRETTRWTPLIESFSDALKALGSFSVIKFASVSKDKMVVELRLSNLKQVALLERFINKSKVLSVLNTVNEDREEILQLTIECDLSEQSRKMQVPLADGTEY